MVATRKETPRNSQADSPSLTNIDVNSRAIADEERKLAYPVQHALNITQNGSLSRLEACRTYLSSINCSRSIQEWIKSHFLLMASVRAGEVPGDPSFDGIDSHWWESIYYHGSSFEMGRNEWNIMKELIKEAEKAGVIAGGSAQILFCARELKQEFQQDTFLLKSALQDVFRYQTLTDERMRYLYSQGKEMDVKMAKVMRHQKVQKVTSIVNAFVACIPLAGGMAAHAISGGAAIMADVSGEAFALSGLVESLLGIGKDLSNNVTEAVIDRFLTESKHILAEGVWNSLPESNRSAVIEATRELGLSVEDLKTRLDVILAGDDGASSVVIEPIEGVDELKSIENEGRANTYADECKENMEVRAEIEDLEKAALNKTTIAGYSAKKLASVLAAFIVSYDPAMWDDYLKIKCCLTELFRSKLIGGAVLVSDKEQIVKKRLGEIADALSKGAEEGKRESVELYLELFMDCIYGSGDKNKKI